MGFRIVHSELRIERLPFFRDRPFRNSQFAVRNAFTVVELLVVAAIIVIILSIGLPMFSAISDSHSVEAARNKISAKLADARAKAIGLAQPVGLAFYRNVNTDRYEMRVVAALNPSDPLAMDFYPDSEAEMLPLGVGAQVLHNAVKTSTSNPERYVATGVIAFDAHGVLMAIPYIVRSGSGLASRSGVSFTTPVSTQVGLALYDREPFRNRNYTDSDPVYTGGSFDSAETAEEAWLDSNAVSLVINRYTGTFLEGRKRLGRTG